MEPHGYPPLPDAHYLRGSLGFGARIMLLVDPCVTAYTPMGGRSPLPTNPSACREPGRKPSSKRLLLPGRNDYGFTFFEDARILLRAPADPLNRLHETDA